jgi:hypothetical protein
MGNVYAHGRVEELVEYSKSLEARLNDESLLTAAARATVEEQDSKIQSLEASIKTLQSREEILKLSLDQLDALRNALRLCSGAADFMDGGPMRDQWLKTCAPLLV